jgi:hypothetical protein
MTRHLHKGFVMNNFAKCLCIMSASTSAFGTNVIEFGGILKYDEPLPSSLALGAFERGVAVMFPERTRLLPNNQEIDISQPGLYNQSTDLTFGVIPSGATVRSFIVHADSNGVSPMVYEGWVRFDGPVFGIITGTPLLNATDPRFGGLSTTYSTISSRGVDFSPTVGQDWISLSPDRRLVSFRLSVSETMDEFRIVTGGSPVPSAGASALTLAGLLTATRRRR